MTKLSDFVTSLETQPVPNGSWAVLGNDTESYEQQLRAMGGSQVRLVPYHPQDLAALDGLLLAEALSTHKAPLLLLHLITERLKADGTLIVIDWQADGPPTDGPDFDVRFKKGRLCRLLRERGFGQIETVQHHPLYYVVRAVRAIPVPAGQSDNFVEVADLADLSRDSMKTVKLSGHNIVIANTGQEIVAFAQACPHANGSLDKGRLRRRNIACPLHGYIWNITTGEPVYPDDEDCLRRYRVKIDQTQQKILVSLATPSEDMVADQNDES